MKPYYSDDSVTIYHADCRDVLPTLELVDHVITDPPYDAHTHSKQRRGAANDGKGKQFGLSKTSISVERHIGFAPLSKDEMRFLSAEFARLSKRWVLVFCAMEQQSEWQIELTSNGLDHVRFGIWHKPGSTPQFSGDRPGTACEAIEIAHPAGRKRWNGGGGFGMWSVPIVKTHTGIRCHPTQKPEELMTSLVCDFTDAGETILDPFMGSGTTLAAAKRIGRKAIGIEMNEQHCETAARRLSQGALTEMFA